MEDAHRVSVREGLAVQLAQPAHETLRQCPLLGGVVDTPVGEGVELGGGLVPAAPHPCPPEIDPALGVPFDVEVDFDIGVRHRDGFASDHVEILQERSAMYRSVAAFERDEKKQLAMHQRRVTLLEPILGELNERVFHATCCQLSFELGECFSDMLELKMAR